MKRFLKQVRAWTPVNHAVTTPVKIAMDLAGVRSRWVQMYLPRSGEVQCVLPDGKVFRLWSRGDEYISNALFWEGPSSLEPETRDLFCRLARRSRVVFDVGAHVGVYSILAALANPECSVHSFEPLPKVFARLERNLAINRIENVTRMRAAAGASDGTAEFVHIADDTIPSSSSLSREFMSSHPTTETSRVEVVALDSYARANGLAHVDLVKIDTETTEPDVLRGMARTLERDHPAIFCEVLSGHETGGALAEVLGPLGYRYYHLTGDGPVARDEIRGHEVWRNYLFTTAGAEELQRLLAPE